MQKTVGGVTHTYYLNGSQILAEKWGNCYIEYLYDENGNPLSVYYYNGTTVNQYYFITNLQGDVVQLRDVNKNIVANYNYNAWGKIISVTNASGVVITDTTSFALINPIRYRGYYYDTETGFYSLQSRYYDPEIGRFINADDSNVLTADCENMVQYNLYAYCFNNPVNMSDDDGYWPSWVKKAVAAVAVVAVVAAVAAVTVATAGAGTAAAVIAVGALKGAAIGMATGAAIGAGTGAVKHRLSTGSWKGAGQAALDGGASGALSGAITGAITGAVSSAVKVGQAAKAWDASSKGGSLKNMSNHYTKHVLQEGKSAMTKNVITYTNDAKALWNTSNGVGKLMSSGSLRLSGTGVRGFYSPSGLIRSFMYQ